MYGAPRRVRRGDRASRAARPRARPGSVHIDLADRRGDRRDAHPALATEPAKPVELVVVEVDDVDAPGAAHLDVVRAERVRAPRAARPDRGRSRRRSRTASTRCRPRDPPAAGPPTVPNVVCATHERVAAASRPAVPGRPGRTGPCPAAARRRRRRPDLLPARARRRADAARRRALPRPGRPADHARPLRDPDAARRRRPARRARPRPSGEAPAPVARSGAGSASTGTSSSAPRAVLVRVGVQRGLRARPSSRRRDADDLYDQLAATLARRVPAAGPLRAVPHRRARHHRRPGRRPRGAPRAARRPDVRRARLPTFRADRYMDPASRPGPAALDGSPSAAGVDTSTYAGLLDALRARREAFIAGGRNGDRHRRPRRRSEPLGPRRGTHPPRRPRRRGSPPRAVAYRRNMLYRLAEMSARTASSCSCTPA